MKSAAFDYVRPASLADAVAILAREDRDCQVMAGGQSLLAMMNLRVAAPELVVDIRTLPELIGADEDEASVGFGACTPHAAIEDGLVADPSRGLMKLVAAGIAYRAVRTRGTLGGSLALSDPAADWVTVMPGLGARIELLGPGGVRSVAADVFMTGIYETVRARDEIICCVRVPKLSDGGRWGWSKFTRKTGEFATSMAVAVIDPARSYARVVLGGLTRPPVLLGSAAREMLAGADLARVLAAAADDLAVHAALFDGYQQGLHGAMVARAIGQVMA